MIGPLNSQLNAIKWGEFRLGDLFEKIIIKPLPYQTAQLPKEKTPTHELPALTAGILNQGLNNFVPKENATILKNVISISANGANTGATFYQPHEFCVLQDAYAIEFIGDKKLNDKEYLFFVCAISKVIYNNSKYEWTNKAGWNKVKNELISLPLKPTAKTQTLKDIDFHFMEKFIAELEQCRLAELQAYLKATGLENTTLSNDEENAINVFNGNNSGGGNTPCGLTWQSFRLGDLFEIRPTKAYNLTNSHLFDSNAKNPVVTNSSLNNGISGYSSLEPTEKGNQITYSDTTTSEGIFYQKRPFIGYSHVQGLYPLKYHEFWNEKTLLYIVVAFKKVACGRFNYGNKFNRKIASEMSIILPTNQHGKIDFDFMHTLINALMKQTIQGVAQYCGAKIQATKEIISQETPIQKDSLF
ncbi:type II restriction endonuclease [Helicobacter pylori]|uniref:restriction endonuclease subunit S n=1 Tax=Helicobacter pylori TaxID=210 RepID=UPI000D398F6D|nr:restriction endonuclease subunit S [Helicobacter pylori]PUD16125.1 type II restriction endonuclease [Helicobacter pylori]WRF22660.1 restriction endonuclease subunit S [Helicobacter pylori]